MSHTPRDAIISVVSDKNSASAASNSMPGQALVPNLNQRSSWQSQSQQPLTSPMTSEAGAGGYPHAMIQPHQIPLGSPLGGNLGCPLGGPLVGPLGGHGKKKRGRPPGSKNKIKVKRNDPNLESDIPKLGLPRKIQRKDASENDGDTSGHAVPTQGSEGQEMTFGDSVLPHHNNFDHGGQINYGLNANSQYQASTAAGLDNAAHAAGAPTEWPQNHSPAPEGQEMSFGGSILPRHNNFDHGGQTNCGFQANLQYQASEAPGLDNATHAAGAPTEWPQNHPPAPIHVNYITNSNVILNYGPPAHAYYPTK